LTAEIPLGRDKRVFQCHAIQSLLRKLCRLANSSFSSTNCLASSPGVEFPEFLSTVVTPFLISSRTRLRRRCMGTFSLHKKPPKTPPAFEMKSGTTMIPRSARGFSADSSTGAFAHGTIILDCTLSAFDFVISSGRAAGINTSTGWSFMRDELPISALGELFAYACNATLPFCC